MTRWHFFFEKFRFQISNLKKCQLIINGIISESNYLNKNNILMGIKIQPLADRVLVEPAAAETTTASGIIIPDNAKEKPQKGTIVAVGNGKKDEPLTVKVGDSVLYGKYGGTELKLEGKDYLMMRESDILAIV